MQQENERVKWSRPFRIDPSSPDFVFPQFQHGAIRSLTQDEQRSVLAHAATHPFTQSVAASGDATGFHAEWIRNATSDDGEQFHKINRFNFTPQNDGTLIRIDTTYRFSSPENGQVNDHHQSPEQTRERLGDAWDMGYQ